MKAKTAVALFILLSSPVSFSETADSGFEPGVAYTLIFSDEFNTDGPIDPKKWVPEVGFKRNEEEQYYRAENQPPFPRPQVFAKASTGRPV